METAILAAAAVESGISFNTALNSVALAVVAGVTVYQTWRSDRREKAKAAQEVILEAARTKQLEGIAESQKEIHVLVNSPYGIALESLAVALDTLARASKEPADIARAAQARKQSDDHKAKQATVDAAK